MQKNKILMNKIIKFYKNNKIINMEKIKVLGIYLFKLIKIFKNKNFTNYLIIYYNQCMKVIIKHVFNKFKIMFLRKE